MKIRGLRQIAHNDIVRPRDGSCIWFLHANKHFQQGRFSSAIDANNPNLFRLVNGKRRILKKRCIGEILCNVFYVYQIHLPCSFRIF